MANETPLLSLDTFVERDRIKITSKLHPEGRLYELVNPDELSVVDHARIRSRHNRTVDLRGVTELDEQQAQDLTDALDDLVTIVMPAVEAEVLADLSDGKKAQVLDVWMRQHKMLTDAGGDGPPPTGAA